MNSTITARTEWNSDERSTPRVLYVEGDAFVEQVPSRFLVSCGCAVTVAHSAAEAWNLCKSDQVTFDLIIADGDSPTMGGIDLVTKLRSVRYSAAIVVFLARMDDDLVRGYQGLGTKRILQKPLELSELRERAHIDLDARLPRAEPTIGQRQIAADAIVASHVQDGGHGGVVVARHEIESCGQSHTGSVVEL